MDSFVIKKIKIIKRNEFLLNIKLLIKFFISLIKKGEHMNWFLGEIWLVFTSLLFKNLMLYCHVNKTEWIY